MAQTDPPKPRFRITLLYLFAVAAIYLVTAVAWLYLGAVTQQRTEETDYSLRNEVGQLWGGVHAQRPPQTTLPQQQPPKPPAKTEAKAAARDKACAGKKRAARDRCKVAEAPKQKRPAPPPPACLEELSLEPQSTDALAKLSLQHRRKGLLWYSTYGVDFRGRYTVENPAPCPRSAEILVPFPSRGAIYDEFSVLVDGKPAQLTLPEAQNQSSRSRAGALVKTTLGPGKRHTVEVRYRSRGMDRWAYALGEQTARARNFRLVVQTDFDEVDFGAGSLSPSHKERSGAGWTLTWKFGNLLSDAGIAVSMPRRLNPGPLSSEISRFAPVSLFFFFFVLMLVSVLRQVRLHPVHYGMLAAAFFSFHLLLAYLVDHLPLWLSFTLASATSVGLVVSYLRLAVGGRFALLWAGGAQLLYLVLFSLAFFLEGYTGLTITIFSILTLFVVMQLTGRIDWSEVFGRARRPDPEDPGPGQGTPPDLRPVAAAAGLDGVSAAMVADGAFRQQS